ncbi:MAG: AAA family ATPase [Edaphobacter sp.]|uniref:AAA family ATPase n=1 Tax=Edaphobacter sp. TaxID=1934404 RepID=UPI00239976AE|nr:AAA family ATPase [Edaphobacter sp.]MDE1178474.1 AAA family ATPase [Edaphobacter sp.]
MEESIDWLWEGYLPKGKLTLFYGAGGTGKSDYSFLHLAATITNGGLWPDGYTVQRSWQRTYMEFGRRSSGNY